MKHRCPVCKRVIKISPKEQAHKGNFFPFCSRRCKLVDLGAWLDTEYKIISSSSDTSPESFIIEQ